MLALNTLVYAFVTYNFKRLIMVFQCELYRFYFNRRNRWKRGVYAGLVCPGLAKKDFPTLPTPPTKLTATPKKSTMLTPTIACSKIAKTTTLPTTPTASPKLKPTPTPTNTTRWVMTMTSGKKHHQKPKAPPKIVRKVGCFACEHCLQNDVSQQPWHFKLLICS